jgi:hypothetical protein
MQEIKDETALLHKERDDVLSSSNDFTAEYCESKTWFGHAKYVRYGGRWRLRGFESSFVRICENVQEYGNHFQVYLFNRKKHIFLVGPDYITFLVTLLIILAISALVLAFPAWCISFRFGVFCSILLVTFLTFYFRVSLRNPGIIPRRRETLSCVLEEGSSDHTTRVKTCKTCNIVRPKGSFHCHTCDACIEGMDHHCPFTGHCIGKHNLIDFYLFLVFLYLTLVVYVGALAYFAIHFTRTGGNC